MADDDGKVVSLDDYRPHLVIQTMDGCVHTFPVSTFEDILNGEQPPSVLGDDVLKLIILLFMENYIED